MADPFANDMTDVSDPTPAVSAEYFRRFGKPLPPGYEESIASMGNATPDKISQTVDEIAKFEAPATPAGLATTGSKPYDKELPPTLNPAPFAPVANTGAVDRGTPMTTPSAVDAASPRPADRLKAKPAPTPAVEEAALPLDDDEIPEQEWEKEPTDDTEEEDKERDPEAFDDVAEETASLGGSVSPKDAAKVAGRVAGVKNEEQMSDLMRTLGARKKALTSRLGGEEGDEPEPQTQDLAAWEDKRDKIWDLYQENKDRTDWAAAAEVFGQLLVQWMAGAQGMRTGVDMSGVKFRTQDWSKSYDRLLDEARIRLKDTDTQQAADQHRVDAVNKEIAQFHADMADAQEKEAATRSHEKISRESNQTQRDVHAANNATTLEAARIAAASRGGKDIDHASRASAARSGYEMASRELGEYDEASTLANSSDLLDKSSKQHETAVRAFGKLARASKDPALIKAMQDYKEGATGSWNKLFGDDPAPALQEAIEKGRGSLVRARTDAYNEMRDASGLDRPRAGSAPAAARAEGPPGAGAGKGIAEGSRTTDKKSGKKLIYRNGRWVEDV